MRAGGTATDYLYTSQRNEAEIGLDYYVARFYDPVTAHFIQPDTIVPEAGSPKAYDRYGYANNNPVRYNDPSGHISIEDDRTSCQTVACVGSNYYWGKEEKEQFEERRKASQEILKGYKQKSKPTLAPEKLFEPKIGTEKLDYEFFSKKSNPYTTQLSGIEYSKIVYDTGSEFKWWKPIPLLSEAITAGIQIERDRGKGYSLDTEISCVGVVILEDALISGLATGASALATTATIPTGFGAVVIGASTYWNVTVILSSPIDNINYEFLFPYLEIE